MVVLCADDLAVASHSWQLCGKFPLNYEQMGAGTVLFFTPQLLSRWFLPIGKMRSQNSSHNPCTEVEQKTSVPPVFEAVTQRQRSVGG
jgi:hypothetical protein